MAALVSFFLLGIVCLYQFAGLKYYIKVIDKFGKYSESERAQAITEFYGDKYNTKRYTGILAGVNKNGVGGVWVWGRLGLIYFPAGVDSVFLFTDNCSGRPFIPNIDGTLMTKETSINIQHWSEKVRTGDFVIIISKSDVGLLNKNFEVASAYNSWLFLQSDSKTACEK